MTGGHYKLTYQRAAADSARQNMDVEGNPLNQKLGSNPAGSTIERVGSGGRMVDLDIKHLFNNIAENVHYIAYAELAQRMNSMFTGSANPVTESLINHYGQPWYDNLMATFEAIVDPKIEEADPFWTAARWVRTNLTFAYLAVSVRNVVQQPVAATNAFAQLGEKWTMGGFWDFYRGGPSATIGRAKVIRKRSVFMRNRTALINREAREQLTKIDSVHPAVGVAKNIAFAPQTIGDSAVVYAVWLGAESKYRKENPNATEKEVVTYADKMVANTVGSGLSKDVGSIFNKGEAYKQLTFMGTFFNLTFNMHVENYELHKRGEISTIEYSRRLAWMAVIPGLLSALLVDDWPEDPEDIPGHVAWTAVQYNMAAVFALRDLASAIDGFDPSMPFLKLWGTLAGVGTDAVETVTGEKEWDLQAAARLMRDLQPIIPIPSQVPRMIEGAMDDNQDWWGTLVEGKERNK